MSTYLPFVLFGDPGRVAQWVYRAKDGHQSVGDVECVTYLVQEVIGVDCQRRHRVDQEHSQCDLEKTVHHLVRLEIRHFLCRKGWGGGGVGGWVIGGGRET